MDLGEFDGMKVQDWAEQYPDYRKAWNENPASVKIPGGESLKEVQARAKGTLECITRIYPPKSTILISRHNYVNLTILCDLLKIPINRFRNCDKKMQRSTLSVKKGIGCTLNW